MCTRSQRVQWWLTDRILALTEVSGQRIVIWIIAVLLAAVMMALLFGSDAWAVV